MENIVTTTLNLILSCNLKMFPAQVDNQDRHHFYGTHIDIDQWEK